MKSIYSGDEEDFEKYAEQIADVMRDGGTAGQLQIVALGIIASVFVAGVALGRDDC